DTVYYPAAYDNVIAVGATDISDNRASYPSWGSNWGDELDLTAPGVNINSTLPGDTSGLQSGTSMAAPFVSGVASLAISFLEKEGTSWDNGEIRDILVQNADAVNGPGYPTRDYYTGYGRVNSFNVMTFLESGGFASEGAAPIAFPNPFDPYEMAVRLRLSERNSSTVKGYKIFALSGQLVRSESGLNNKYARWDGRNDSGDVCASGLYFFQLVTFDGNNETGKVTLLR
ncbi:MAG: S8 family peptidase, partial [Elusimicrobiota bacterium]|nr:S8 family peptidase [Elusimicrobiota bacterium]